MALKNDRYTYRVTWSEEDSEYIGLCAEFPSLSWLASTPEAALRGIRQVVAAKAVMRQSLLTPVVDETALRELMPASTRLMLNVPLAVAGTLVSLGLSAAALLIALLR